LSYAAEPSSQSFKKDEPHVKIDHPTVEPSKPGQDIRPLAGSSHVPVTQPVIVPHNKNTAAATLGGAGSSTSKKSPAAIDGSAIKRKP
jgi:hypothetical protein